MSDDIEHDSADDAKDGRSDGTCPARPDGLHCNHWWDGDGPCCGCGFDGDLVNE